MRPISNSQNFIKHPLSKILGGGEASIRVIRVLCEFSNQHLSLTTLSQKTGLSLNGVKRTIEELEDLGIVLRAGTGSRCLYSLRQAHPLAEVLTQLFVGEQSLESTLKNTVRDIFRNIDPELSVWLHSESMAADYSSDNPVVFCVLGNSSMLSSVISTSLEKISKLEVLLDISIEIRGITEADVETYDDLEIKKLENSDPIMGLPPLAFIHKTVPKEATRSSNKTQKLTSRALSEAVVKKLKEDSTIVSRALDRLKQQLKSSSGSTKNELLKWQRLLESGSVPRITKTLLGSTDSAERMRQSNPFTTFLSTEERNTAISSVKGDQK